MDKKLPANSNQTLASQVYETLLDRIIRFNIKPFEQLSEVQLSKELGVSRTPVREAFHRLADRGFLEIYPQRGTCVSPLRVESIECSQFMREAFEIALIRRAVSLEDNTGLVAEMGKQIKLQTVFAEIRDEKSFFASDEDFHHSIAQYCGLPGVWNEVQMVKQHMDRLRHITMIDAELDDVLEQHQNIFEAVKNRDEATAIECMTVHLRRINNQIRQVEIDYADYFDSSS